LRTLFCRIEELTMTETKMDLKLSSREVDVLGRALARRSAEMLDELVHTSDRKAHAELKGMYEELDALCRRVQAIPLAE
jgi:phage host-nuclease inhibitor protein Gam